MPIKSKLTICYDKIKIKIIFLFVKKKLSAAITHRIVIRSCHLSRFRQWLYCKLTELTIKKTKEIYHNNNNLLFFSGIIYSFATVFHLIGMS